MGKTIFALQSLVNGARTYNEPGIFMAFEESSERIVRNASGFDWNLVELQQEKLLFIDASLRPSTIRSGDFDLEGLLAGVAFKAKEMKARRIVFDSIDVLLGLLDDPIKERDQVYLLHDWVHEQGFTGIFTAKSLTPEIFAGMRYQFLPYLTDAVVLLQHDVRSGISARDLRVYKYRGSSFAENEFALGIGAQGIEIAAPTIDGQVYQLAPTERLSSGVERLDNMLKGGYYRASTVLITGKPGTAKTTFCGAFTEASCRQGEKTLFVTFDEQAGEVVRNLQSVNIHLQEHLESGLLQLYSIISADKSPDEHSLHIRRLVRQFEPRCLVLDPLSALLKEAALSQSHDAILRLLRTLKAAGMTVVCNSQVKEDSGYAEATALEVSTVADTWLHLSNIPQGGERNRALTIVKSRGTNHSNQVRELLLSDEGVTLADVYTAGGEVLMGTARFEKELELKQRQDRLQAEIEHKRIALQLAQQEISARLKSLERELELKRDELRWLTQEQEAEELRQVHAHQKLARQRRSDKAVQGQSAPKAP